MFHKKHYVLILTFLLILSFKVYADNNFLGKLSDKPMEITSNRMEVIKDKQLVVFSGNAKIKQGKSLLKSDKLFLYFTTESDKKNKIGKIEIQNSGDLERIEAKGNVYLYHETRIATGNEAIYYRDSNKVVMTGNATLKDGQNYIKGDSVIVFLDENRGTVEGSPLKPVKAIIYPNDIKKMGTK